ncbi:MAG: TRAP transporter small permease [Desulfobacterales bacterium]|jgi:TRAP-type C4-dicarboxylate transport system permease small subunit
MQAVWKVLDLISDKMKSIGAALLVVMMMLTCVDVVGRLFRHPVFGSIELMSLMGAVAVAMSLPYTHAAKGHIGVEIVINRLPRTLRTTIELLTGLLSMVLFGTVTWKMFEYSIKMKASGEVSMNLGLPEYLVIGVVGIGFVFFTLAILRNIADGIGELRGK